MSIRIETTFRRAQLRFGDRFVSDIDDKSIEVREVDDTNRCGVHINGESCYEWDYPIILTERKFNYGESLVRLVARQHSEDGNGEQRTRRDQTADRVA